MNKFLRNSLAVASLALSVFTSTWAGPVVIDGTDANDHGSFTSGSNVSGWLYMQHVLQNLAATVNPDAAKVVVDLGTTSGQARDAIDSAFSEGLPSGWILLHINGAAAIDAWLAGISTLNTGILYIPTKGHTTGDLDQAELDAINLRATAINNFVGGTGNPLLGGGLFSMGETGSGAYGWLTTLIPGISFGDAGGGGINSNITLTSAGHTAFPVLTDGDLSGAKPWHGYFSGNLGGLSVLGVANNNGERNVIIGGGAGTQITQVPEPTTLVLLGAGLLGLGLSRRMKH